MTQRETEVFLPEEKEGCFYQKGAGQVKTTLLYKHNVNILNWGKGNDNYRLSSVSIPSLPLYFEWHSIEKNPNPIQSAYK